MVLLTGGVVFSTFEQIRQADESPEFSRWWFRSSILFYWTVLLLGWGVLLVWAFQ